MTKKQNSKDSDGSYSQEGSQKMKISLFSKSYITKASSFFIAASLIISIPLSANAFSISDSISGLMSVFGGNQAQADEVTSSSDDNSQNMDLDINREPSINPDLKSQNGTEDIVLVQDDSFIYSDGLPLPDVKFEKSSISDQIVVYTVEKGDTLSEIADTFDVSVNTIRWENNISGNTVSVGQKLNILPMTGVKHVVKAGDTISKIASKYDADTEDILIFNGLSKEDGLKAGNIIFVPNGIIKVSVTKVVSSSGKTTYSNTKAPSGYYLRPVPGRVTSPYGSRRGGFHPGVDLAGTNGVTPVMAAASGTVVQVVSGCKVGARSCGGRYGNHITIEHSNGTMTRYAHLSSTKVKAGQSVSQGQTIGVLGNTGYSTGPHLHFEVINANGSKMRPPVN